MSESSSLSAKELLAQRTLLLEQVETLRASIKESDHVLHVAVHALRNPLSSILMSAEVMLMEESFSALERREMMEGIVHEAERMTKLIGNMLELHAIEQGRVEMQRVPLEVAGIFASVAENYQAKADLKEQPITIKIPEQRGEIEADHDQLVRIFDHLLSNAVKFTPPKGRLTLEVIHNPDNIQCVVKDSGPGLSEIDHQKLFGKFAKLSPKPTGKESTTGLGLAIVKTLVLKMGGKVWCETSLGNGCRFIVEFPRVKK